VARVPMGPRARLRPPQATYQASIGRGRGFSNMKSLIGERDAVPSERECASRLRARRSQVREPSPILPAPSGARRGFPPASDPFRSSEAAERRMFVAACRNFSHSLPYTSLELWETLKLGLPAEEEDLQVSPSTTIRFLEAMSQRQEDSGYLPVTALARANPSRVRQGPEVMPRIPDYVVPGSRPRLP
jgi:hypothetical protein